MEAKRRSQYGKLIRYLEEPIRELVPPIWDLPFVVDMGFTCSGHIVRKPDRPWGERPDFGPYVWYPRRAMLEFAFSIDEALVEARDAFRKDLSAVFVEVDGLKLGFNRVSTFRQECLPHSSIPHSNLSENYDADLPDVPRENDSIEKVEALLTAFWEEVACVVRKHNPEARIGSIAGKSFRSRIEWAHWRSVFLSGKRF